MNRLVLIPIVCLIGCIPTPPEFHARCLVNGYPEDSPEIHNCVSRQKLAWQAQLANNESVYTDPNHPTFVAH